jgi:DNA-binding MarR family transcriptional regulator
VTISNYVFWLREMPTRPGPDGWISAHVLAERLGVKPNHATRAMRQMRSLGFVESGELDACRNRLYRITGAGLKALRAAR